MTSDFFRLEFYFRLKSDWIQFKQGMQKNPSNPIDLQNPRSDGQIGDVAVAFHEVSFLRKKISTVFLLIHTDYRLIELINTNKDMKNWKKSKLVKPFWNLLAKVDIFWEGHKYFPKSAKKPFDATI